MRERSAADPLGATDARMDQDEFQLTPVGRRALRDRDVDDDDDEEWPRKAGDRHTSEYTLHKNRSRAVHEPDSEVVKQTEEATLEAFDS